ESFAMPADDGLRLDDDESGTPAAPELGQPCPEEPIRSGELRSFSGALQDAELMAQSQDLELKGCSGAERRQNGRQQCGENDGWREIYGRWSTANLSVTRNLREPQFVVAADLF